MMSKELNKKKNVFITSLVKKTSSFADKDLFFNLSTPRLLGKIQNMIKVLLSVLE